MNCPLFIMSPPNGLKATSGGLKANFYTESLPVAVALTICAEPSQPPWYKTMGL